MSDDIEADGLASKVVFEGPRLNFIAFKYVQALVSWCPSCSVNSATIEISKIVGEITI